jgi:hypothetical protein
MVARHLRDDLIGPAVEREAVDVILPDQRRQRAADRLHGDAEIVRLGVVDLDVDRRGD